MTGTAWSFRISHANGVVKPQKCREIGRICYLLAGVGMSRDCSHTEPGVRRWRLRHLTAIATAAHPRQRASDGHVLDGGGRVRFHGGTAPGIRPTVESPRIMASITLRVLEGLERGKVYSHLTTPITIGREDDNDIQLNDDRISRFHAKLQDDGGRVILTDLDSTNGTRVNGHAVQMKVLQSGDLVTIGRCVLVFGDLPGWQTLGRLHGDETEPNQTALADGDQPLVNLDDLDFLSPAGGHAEHERLFPQGAPVAPSELRPLHRAQLSDLLAYLHEQVGQVLNGATEETQRGGPRTMKCSWETWQHLVSLQATLASYLRKIADPD
jgi:pSer/pThr/pTyr-binding forkhead associated (FHA) protein